MPGDDEGRGEARDDRTERRRQVCKVTNGTGSLGARRILVPETDAESQEQNGQGRGAKARKMDPITSFLLSASHNSTRAARFCSLQSVNASTDANGSEGLCSGWFFKVTLSSALMVKIPVGLPERHLVRGC